MQNIFLNTLIIVNVLAHDSKNDVLINPVLLNRDWSLNSSNLNNFSKYNFEIQNFYIGIDLNESKLVIDLKLNQKILNQKSLIERKSRNSSHKSFLFDQKPCLFYGNVVNFPNSFASLSFCNNLVSSNFKKFQYNS